MRHSLNGDYAREYRESFIEELLEIRRRHNLSQARLGELAGFGNSLVCRLERGDRLATRAVVEEIIKALAMPWHEADRLRLAAGFAPKHDLPMLKRMKARTYGGPQGHDRRAVSTV